MSDPTPALPPLGFEPKDRPLRRDVGRLGAQLGGILRSIAPAGVYEAVEEARLAARRRRKGDPAAAAELQAVLHVLAPEAALEVVRAFSAYFGVVNTAEQVHRMRRRIDHARSGRLQPGSLAAAAEGLARRGIAPSDLDRALARVRVEPVLTAHPTEVVRRTLLKKDQRLARALVERFKTEASDDPRAIARLDAAIELEIASAWQTEEQLPGRPTVAEEVEHALFFLTDVLYRVVPAVHEELERALGEAFGRPVQAPRTWLRVGSWVGGDMDGNPNVGADTIRATLERHHALALRRYREELRGLHEHLSQSSSRVGTDPELIARCERYEAAMPDAATGVPDRYRAMPYRRLLWLMTARLDRKEQARDFGYGPPEEFAADLELLAHSLEAHGGRPAGARLVRRALCRVATFGFHLAALDVRQDAEVHRAAVAALLDDPTFPERPAAERTERLSAVLAARLSPPARADDEGLARTLDVFRALAEARERYGPEAVGTVIISMARGADDALAVLLLARAGGCATGEDSVPLDVVPLFETVDDLEVAPDVLRALAADPTYERHLEGRGRQQTVMLGYSDSNKDGGIVASRVAIQRAQERLVETADALDVELVFFHGRGGSISRGGSKTRAGLLAAPRGAIRGRARSTEQGEIIAAKFGLRGIATRTLELGLGALLERTADPASAHVPSDVERAVAETMALASRAAYRAFVHEAPEFPELFRTMTPLDVIERMEIGSRPARRRAMRGVQDLRAIPWVFAWTQCRAVLPGWFGVGTGLAAAIESHGLDAVRSAVRAWPFLATLASDVEMVLAKSDLDIAGRYAELAGDVGARLFPRIADEHDRSVAALLEVLEARHLLERDATLARSIRLRNPYVDPLSFVQIDALDRWRATDRTDAPLERLLVQTVRGIARGLRNTG